MKLERWALVAEIVGAIAVVVSLLYVGAGVRQNTEAILSANHQNLVAMDMNKNAWFRDPVFAALYELGLGDPSALTPGQFKQFETFIADQLNIWEYAFISHENGLMADNIWAGYDRFYSSQLRLPAYRSFWDVNKDGWTREFARHADAVLAGVDSGETPGTERGP